MTSRNTTKVITAGAFAFLLTACTTQPTGISTGPTTTQPSFNRQTTSASSGTGIASTPPPPATPSADPVKTAKQWLINYRSISWADAKPSAWIDRVRPVITDRLAAEYDQLRDGSGGADWTDFVQRRCTSTVELVDGTRPSENPGTDTAVTVLVSGEITTTCAAGQPPTPTTRFAATLTVINSGGTGWHVDRQVY